MLLCSVVYARTTTVLNEKLGSFTGPVNGTEQDDNVKASLDLLHGLIGAQLTKGTGEIIYCDSGASGGGTGADWTNAYTTLDAAVAGCTADRGDWIIVAAGHTENISTANGADLDVAGITVLGLGVGDNRPTLSFTNASGEVVIGADDVRIINMRFLANVTAVTTAINVETTFENFIIEDCDFAVELQGTDEFVDCITIAATNTDGGIIRNNYFSSGEASNAGPQSWINFVDCNDLQIYGNTFYGDCAVACIQNETTAANYVTIRDNIIFNGIIGGTAGLNAQPCIELVATTTGTIVNNSLFCNVATPDLAIVGADMFMAGNTYSESEGSAGVSLALSDSAGLKCAYVQPASIAAVTNLFAVTGGPIIIRDIVGVVTTNIVATGCLINYNIDPTEPATDTVFGTDGTALEINGDAAGTVYTWDGVIATDLTATTNGVVLTQGTDVSNGILCPQGMIELAATATNAGVIAFYMVYSPLSPKSTVIPQ
jgi:hypothetical protein